MPVKASSNFTVHRTLAFASLARPRLSGNLPVPDCAIPSLDTLDFFHYTGLPSGGTFDLTLDPSTLVVGGHSLTAGVYTDQTTIADSVTSTTPGPLVHLTGLIPGGGDLTFGIATVNAVALEGYTVALNVASTRVPAPAAIVLLAAGLTAVGLDVARRRKRS